MSLVERFVVGVDMRRYSGRTARQQLLLQRELLQILADAAANSGLNRDSWDRLPAGDGEYAVLPADVDLVAIVRRFVTELDQLLTDHNEDHAPETSIRLRVAMHMDSLARSPNGYVGQGLTVLERLLNSEPVRAALVAAPEANLAQIISATVYDRAVTPELGGIRPRQFQTVHVNIPEKKFRQTAYLYVPNQLTGPHTVPTPPQTKPLFPFPIPTAPPAESPKESPNDDAEDQPRNVEPEPLPPELLRLVDSVQTALGLGRIVHADTLTTHALLDAAGRTPKGSLRASDGAKIPDALLTALDTAWAGISDGAWGFQAQRKRLNGQPLKHRGDFWALSVLVGWRSSENEVVPRYEAFAGRGDLTTPFYPTLRNPEREEYPEWYNEWLSTVMSVHVRLQNWEH